ncbi:unnamed protein product [Durusdinium trenchii]|uniref:Fungal lipase-like domain-containing protein n=1 Tax=Durusdinium trenchii TaxID=1381693 RepID=A0ABP0LSC7_9DINO
MAAVLAHEDVRRNSVRLQRGSPVLTPKYSGPGSALVGGTLIRSRTEPQPDTRRPGQSPNLAPAAGVHHYVQGSGCLSALESAMQLGPRDEELDKDEAAGTATAAPSAALVAAVQRAAKAAKPEALGFSPALAHHRTSPFLRPEEPPAGLVGRRRWASMSEEEMMTGIRRSSKEMHPVDLAAYPSPGMSPTMAPTWRVGRDAAPDAWPGARRRWASLSDDEAASPMLWPMRSPGLHVQRPGRRSQSSTPLLAPTGLAKVSEHAAVESEDFMLPPTPQATPSSSQGPNMSPTSQGKNVPMTPENYPMAWPNWDPNAMGGFPSQVPPAWPQMWIMPRENSGWPQVDVPGYPGMPGVNEMGGYPPVGNHFGWMPMGPEAQMWLPSEANEMPGELSGPWMQFEDSAQAVSAAGPAPAGTGGASWSLVWIGERASRAQASEKEELEQLGFTVKIYRTHDRCSRVLDKKSTLAATTVFLISEAEAAPMLEYLQKRGASGLRVLVEADGYSPEQAWELNKSLPTLEDFAWPWGLLATLAMWEGDFSLKLYKIETRRWPGRPAKQLRSSLIVEAHELIQRQANLEARDRRHRFAALHLVSARGGLGGSWFCRFAEVDLCGGGSFARLVSGASDVEETFFRSETQPVLHQPLDPKLAHAHLEIAAFAKNISLLDSLAEDLVKALDDLETAAHQVRLRQRGYSLLRFLGLEREEDSVPTLEAPLLARSTRFHPRDMTPKAKMVLQMRGRFMSLLNDSLGYVKEHPNQEGVALFHQRITMALNIIGDADQPAQVLAAVKEIRRLFPFEVDPLDDMPFLAVYMCSLRIRWSYFLLCALFTALALFAGTITELFFAVFADGDKLDFQVWLSFWLLPFGAMLLALVGDEMSDLVIDAIDRPPLLWCLALLLAALQRDRRLAPARSSCEMVDLLLVVLSELVPLTFALRGFLLRKGFWHGYMQGGLVAAFLLTVAVLLADLAIAIHGLQAQQALRHIYHVLDKHKIFPGILSVRYDTFRAHFEQVSSEESSERSCQRFATLIHRSWKSLASVVSDSWASSRAAMSGIWQIPSVLGAWTVISALAMQEVIDFPVCISAIMMVITVATMSLKMAWTFPDIAGPFYTVILIFFVSAALGLQVGGAFSLAPKAAVEPLMNSRPGDEPLLPLWRGNDMPPYAACHITWGSRDAQLSQLDMAALALIAYEENCDEMDRLLKESFGKRSPRLEHCSSYSELPRWVAVRFSPTHGIGCGTRVFALKGTSSWRDVYADIKLFATIEVLQALSKIVPILSLLPVALVQGIVGYTGNADAHVWKSLEDAIIASEKDRSDATVLTGHSLGGCIAQIVAARQQLPALVFSSPGVLYSARRFQIVPESARHVVVVVPDGDVIATVDEHAGVVQRIACFKKNGQAASTATCHRLRKTACEVWRACGDAWGRDFSTTCGGYVSPDILGKSLIELQAIWEADKSPIPGEMGIHELQQLPGEMSSKAKRLKRLVESDPP